MGDKSKLVLIGLAVIGGLVVIGISFWGVNVAVLDPKGTIADQERDLIVTATALMLLIVVPVFAMTAFIAWRYRAGNTKATYSPDWDHNRLVEFSWWAIPTVIIAVLSVIAWQSSHKLDPYRPLDTDKPPVNVQVIALQWRWLFIYPELGIASINHIQIPTGRPINFQITADAPMNSFWVPQLGGQIYAMSGMSTRLHLQADAGGTYNGMSANISGEGFANMRFTVRAGSETDFQAWIEATRQSGKQLDLSSYDLLADPSKDTEVLYFSTVQHDLYNQVVAKFGHGSHQAAAPHHHGSGE